jgi:predicted RNase H-like HicB family nuclease
MQIPVLVEALADNGFCARTGEPLPLSAEGATREEAMAKLRLLLDVVLRKDKELVALEVPAPDNPWLAMAGMYDPNDPLVRDWKEAMAAYRCDVESDPDYP